MGAPSDWLAIVEPRLPHVAWAQVQWRLRLMQLPNVNGSRGFIGCLVCALGFCGLRIQPPTLGALGLGDDEIWEARHQGHTGCQCEAYTGACRLLGVWVWGGGQGTQKGHWLAMFVVVRVVDAVNTEGA